MMPPQVPETVGRYRILRPLGSGAMGDVYLAEDPTIGRQLAIKTVRQLPGVGSEGGERHERLLREARAAGRLLHPHIVTLFDADEVEGMLFLAFEYVPGQDLGARLAQGPAFTVPEALRLLRQVASALDYAHRQGIIHRDIKPGNILLDEHGQAKVADFGIAKLLDQSTHLTQTGSVVGSPLYMSPEQIRGETLDGRSDLFAVGVMFYEMLTTRRPFRGDTISTLVFQILSREPTAVEELRPDLPPQLCALVSSLMAKDREQRMPDAASLAAAVARTEQALGLGDSAAPLGVAAPASATPSQATASADQPGSSLPVFSQSSTQAEGGGGATTGSAPGAQPPLPPLPGQSAAPASPWAQNPGVPPVPAGAPQPTHVQAPVPHPAVPPAQYPQGAVAQPSGSHPTGGSFGAPMPGAPMPGQQAQAAQGPGGHYASAHPHAAGAYPPGGPGTQPPIGGAVPGSQPAPGMGSQPFVSSSGAPMTDAQLPMAASQGRRPWPALILVAFLGVALTALAALWVWRTTEGDRGAEATGNPDRVIDLTQDGSEAAGTGLDTGGVDAGNPRRQPEGAGPGNVEGSQGPGGADSTPAEVMTETQLADTPGQGNLDPGTALSPPPADEQGTEAADTAGGSVATPPDPSTVATQQRPGPETRGPQPARGSAEATQRADAGATRPRQNPPATGADRVVPGREPAVDSGGSAESGPAAQGQPAVAEGAEQWQREFDERASQARKEVRTGMTLDLQVEPKEALVRLWRRTERRGLVLGQAADYDSREDDSRTLELPFAGDYLLALQHEGFPIYIVKVHASGERANTAVLNARLFDALEDIGGDGLDTLVVGRSIAFQGTPAEAVVVVDGVRRGPASKWPGGMRPGSSRNLSPGIGLHEVRLEAPGYKPYVLRVLVKPGAPQRKSMVKYRLERD